MREYQQNIKTLARLVEPAKNVHSVSIVAFVKSQLKHALEPQHLNFECLDHRQKSKFLMPQVQGLRKQVSDS